MIETWYAILAFMLTAFVMLEGFDFGAGMLQYIVGKTQAERRTVIAAIGPFWTWNEVWLVAFGGTLLMAFPTILAVSFSGFYLAFFLVLWALVLRGVSIEVGGHINDPMWRSAWDGCFVLSNVLLAVLFGAAFGNVLRGVPLGPDGKFALALFTNFSPYGKVGILDWYTVSVAVFIVVAFLAHGATGLAHRTEGDLHERSMRVAGILWKVVPILLVGITIETWAVRPALFTNMIQRPVGWLGLLCVGGGVVAVFLGMRRKRTSVAMTGSIVLIAGLMIAGAAGVFPLMLRSTLSPEYSLSAYHTAADGYGLTASLFWWPVALIFSLGYFQFVYRHYSGKVKPAQDTQTPY